MVAFCREHGIPHEVCGKVIVATSEAELPRLEELRQRGEANGLSGLRLIGPEELREIEPHAVGLQALLVPSSVSIEIDPKRGTIYDRNMRPLAMSVPVESAFAIPSEIKDTAMAARLLSVSALSCATWLRWSTRIAG